MVTTGLLSLNIHEPLTFDGTEIVLHPDLFGSSNWINGGDGLPATAAAGTSSFTTTVAGASNAANRMSLTSVVVGAGAGAGSSSNNSGPRLSLVPTGSSEDKLTTAAAPSSSSNRPAPAPTAPAVPLLQVGDWMEIRVWDPLPRSSAATSESLEQHHRSSSNNVTSVLRRHHASPPLVPSSSAGSGGGGPQQQLPGSGPSSVGSSSVHTGGQSHPGVGGSGASLSTDGLLLQEAVVTLNNRNRAHTTGHSLQHSEASQTLPHLPHGGPSETTTTTISGATTVDDGILVTREAADEASTASSGDRTHSVHNVDGGGSTTPATSTTPLPSPKSIKSEEPVSSIKSTVTPTSDLPPVFPRSLLNNLAPTSDPSATSLPPKPPVSSTSTPSTTLPRRNNPPLSSSSLLALNAASAAALETTAVAATRPVVAPTPAPLLRPRHFRDLSDMTIDTVYDTTSGTSQPHKTLLDGSHQLVDLHVPLSTGAAACVTANPVPRAASTTALLGSAPTDDEDDVVTHLSNTHRLRLSFVMPVGEHTFTSLKGSARTQVSLLRPIAELYNLSSFDTVTIRKIEPQHHARCLQSCRADFVLVTIKDQFISRGEMQGFLQESLLGSWVYEGQRLLEAGRNIQATARQIRHQDLKVPSGIITEDTKITFRSRSARFVWLVQLSSEMWDYAAPYEHQHDESKCETYFDKWISFVRRLFDRWKEVEVTHSLTVVFFSRTFIGDSPPMWSGGAAKIAPSKDRDIYGRQYEDHFRIVIENETSSDWENLVVLLKEAFVNYPSEVGWNLSTGNAARRPSSASQGNVLEATNVTLNLLQYHYLDRDLHRTGNSIVIISAGHGVFEVDKGLAAITYERMMVNGIGSDMLSLALPPLHTAPFFLYVNDRSPEDGGSLDFGGLFYEVPHWMHLSFVSYNSEERLIAVADRNESKKETPCLIEIDGRPLLANGFMLPRVIDVSAQESRGTSPLLRPMTGPISPVKQTKIVSQARQLITGRDFNDILEACRPRNFGHLPSALEAIIRMSQPADSVHWPEKNKSQKTKGDGTSDPPEWGSLEFDSSSDSPLRQNHRRVVALGQEPGVDVSPRLSPLPSSFLGTGDVREIERAERDSLASSPASHISGGLGFSYDRPFLASGASPTLTGIQVQRSPSFDIFLSDADDDESVQSGGSNSSSESFLGDGVRVKRNNRTQKFFENFKKKMRAFDSQFLTLDTPRLSSLPDRDFNALGDGLSDTGPAIGSTSQHQRSVLKSSNQTGGIGAALTQYRSVTSGSSLAPEPPEARHSVARVASTTRLATMAPQRMHVPEMGSRGISPLYLPPVVMSSSEIPMTTVRSRPLEQRLVHPSEFSRSGFESLSRLASRNTLSRSPPLSGSPALVMSMMSSAGSNRHSSRPTQNTQQPSRSRSKSRLKSRRKKAFNPFRQEDEDEVLAKKSHNRRRWSHVFPFGEVEFKRHAGPNWNSLSSPAILPIFIDYFPSQQEVDHNFTFSYYNITLSEFENSPYSSNKDFLMEMVRQRLTQDYQLVPPTHINPSNYRRQSMSRTVSTVADADGSVGVIRQFLSMGHRLQVLSYDPSADVIEVTLYDAKTTRETTGANTFVYHYRCYCQETQSYSKVVQTFEKYASPYNWNKVDRIICGDEERELREGMRFKRLMFAIIPDRFDTDSAEKQYVAKFQRLLEYLNKLRDKGEATDTLDIQIVTSSERSRDPAIPVESTPGVERDGMKRFYVRLRKGKLDKLEWMEIVVDATFDTIWSYRIMFHWLVAGSAKVETQVQLLQRRCSQFGLTLVPIPQISVSKNPYLGPFKAPAILVIREKNKGVLLDQVLYDLDFLHDGVFLTDARMIVNECLDDGHDFDFGKRWSRLSAGRQFLHRSGTLFARVLADLNGRVLVVVLGNYLYISKDPTKLQGIAHAVFRQLSDRIHDLVVVPAEDTPMESLSLSASPSNSPSVALDVVELGVPSLRSTHEELTQAR